MTEVFQPRRMRPLPPDGWCVPMQEWVAVIHLGDAWQAFVQTIACTEEQVWNRLASVLSEEDTHEFREKMQAAGWRVVPVRLQVQHPEGTQDV